MHIHEYRSITFNKFINSIFLVIFAVLTISISRPGITWSQDVIAKTGLSYHWWDSTNHEKGQQFYVPLDVAVKFENYALRILTGYMYSYYDGRGVNSVDLARPLDTKINLSAKGKTIGGIKWLAGLDMNWPTGKTDLSDKDLSLLMDPDLVPVNPLGEGFNLNPIVILAHSWGVLWPVWEQAMTGVANMTSPLILRTTTLETYGVFYPRSVGNRLMAGRFILKVAIPGTAQTN